MSHGSLFMAPHFDLQSLIAHAPKFCSKPAKTKICSAHFQRIRYLSARLLPSRPGLFQIERQTTRMMITITLTTTLKQVGRRLRFNRNASKASSESIISIHLRDSGTHCFPQVSNIGLNWIDHLSHSNTKNHPLNHSTHSHT